jgi:hypothetical protein
MRFIRWLKSLFVKEPPTAKIIINGVVVAEWPSEMVINPLEFDGSDGQVTLRAKLDTDTDNWTCIYGSAK